MFEEVSRNVHARTRHMHKRACMFLYLVIILNGAKIGGDEENESCSEGSNV